MDNMGMTEALRLELVNAIQAMEQAVIDGDFPTFKKNREIKNFLMLDILPDIGDIEESKNNKERT